jgi:hypothetical protein
MKDLLRFDTIVAACALLMSAITAGAMVYQTRVLQDQFSATVWPYLSVEDDYDKGSVALRLINQGVGPALIRSAQVSVDGKPVAGWDKSFFTALFGQSITRSYRRVGLQVADGSVDSSSALRAGDARTLIAIRIARPDLIHAALKHRVELRFCYCSINEKCWTLQTGPARSGLPTPVSGCRTVDTIAAPTNPFA